MILFLAVVFAAVLDFMGFAESLGQFGALPGHEPQMPAVALHDPPEAVPLRFEREAFLIGGKPEGGGEIGSTIIR